VTSYDLTEFTKTFDGLMQVLIAKRLDDGERAEMVSQYFKALRRFSIEQVKAGAEVALQRSKHFPKPVEWIEWMPQAAVSREIPLMTREETDDYRRAEQQGWEDQPCLCSECCRAGVDWKPLRYVPNVGPDGRDVLKRDGARDRVVVSGYWAHGRELAGYYRAVGEFYSLASTKQLGSVARAIGKGQPV
jgi:hypothetical protein